MGDVGMVAASCALTDEAQAVFCSDQGRKVLSCVFLEKIVSTWVLCWGPRQNPLLQEAREPCWEADDAGVTKTRQFPACWSSAVFLIETHDLERTPLNMFFCAYFYFFESNMVRPGKKVSGAKMRYV